MRAKRGNPSPLSWIATACGLDDAAIDPVQAAAGKRILRAFAARSLIESPDAKEMGGKPADLVLTPLALIDRIAALVPLPNAHQNAACGRL